MNNGGSASDTNDNDNDKSIHNYSYNPPPSKLLRSKLATVNNASSKRKNTKNLYLNVRPGSSSGGISPPKLKSPRGIPPSTPYVQQAENTSRSPSLRSASSSVSNSPNHSPKKLTTMDSLPSIITSTGSGGGSQKLKPSTSLSISIPEHHTNSVSSPFPSLAPAPAQAPPPTLSRLIPPQTAMGLRTMSPTDPTDRTMNYNAYPNGPIMVYSPNVYLYSEPNADIAYQFDVVINVAKEVKNPFHKQCEPSTSTSTSPISQDSDQSSNCSSPTEHLTSPPSSVESTPDLSISPSKPPGWGSSTNTKEPEYIYVPWDHNSKLVNELHHLTEIIENRSLQNKKILIHCQCGVSRSASLVVAYVMRKNRWDLNTAYDFVKDRSPNIGPNMTLMFQLLDWQKILKTDPSSRSPSDVSECPSPIAAS